MEGLLRRSPLPAWLQLGSALGLSGDWWQPHDPADEVAALAASWDRPAIEWTGVCVLWVGIETDGVAGFLEVAGFAEQDDTGFPRRRLWAMAPIVSSSLTAFARYRHETGDEGYGYWAPLAWTGLLVQLAGLTPPNTTTLAGFAGGDWLTFPPQAGR